MRTVRLVVAVAVAIAGCQSSGSSPASPRIRGGFPLTPDRRIPHAVQVRVADTALHAVEAAAPEVLASLLRDGIQVPRTEQSVSQGWSRCTIVACPHGCRIPIQLAGAHPVELHLEPPDRVRAAVHIAVPLTTIPIEGCSMAVDFTLDTSRGTRPTVGLQTAASVRTEYRPERASYDRIDLDDFDEMPSEQLEDDDFDCRGAGLARMICGAVNTFLRGEIHNRLRAQLAAATNQVRTALAEPSTDPPGCPTGTHADGAHCAYGDGHAVAVLLGMDGETPLGTGASDPTLRWLVAAGDPYTAPAVTPNAVTVSALGALFATSHASCVPQIDPPRAPIVPELTSLRTTGAGDVTIAVSEDFVNVAMFGLWDGGALCSGATQSRSSELAGALLAALPATSPLRTALLPNGATSFGVAVHSERPPRVTFASGSDAGQPLIRVAVPQLTVEFVDTRGTSPVRLLSVTADASANVDLTVSGNELRATASHVVFANASATGTNLAPDVQAAASSLVTSNATAFVTRAIGEMFPLALPRVPLPNAGTFEIAPAGVAAASEGSSRFLTVAANVRYRPR